MTSGEDNNEKLVPLQKLIIIELWANQQSNGKLIAVMKNLGFLNPKERWLTNYQFDLVVHSFKGSIGKPEFSSGQQIGKIIFVQVCKLNDRLEVVRSED